MATDLGSLVYTLKLDDAGFTGELNSAKEKVSGASQGMTGSLKETEEATGGLKGAFGGMAGQFVLGQAVFSLGQKALDQVTGVIKDGIQAAKDWQTQQAGLNAVLKSTGDASGMTAEEVSKLAEETENKTAIEKSATLSGENMLLTFTNIGKNTFPAATQAMTDMATRMAGGMIPNGQQLSQTAIQLGIALNDPIHGISRLHRVGVAFTDQQKAQIKSMQDAGNMAGAQAVIIKELNHEFGGQAASNMQTFTGQWTLFREKLAATVGTIIQNLIPVLEKIGLWIFNHKPVLAALIGIIGGLAIAIGVGLVTALWGMVAPAVTAAAALWPIVVVGAAIGAIGYEIYTHWNQINKALKPVYEFFDKNIKPVLNEIWKIVKEQLIKAWDDLVKAFNEVMKAIKPFEPQLKIIGIAIGIALVAPLALAVVAIVATVAAIVAIGVFLARLIGWLAEAGAAVIKWAIGFGEGVVHVVEAVVGTGAKIVQWFVDLPGNILRILAGAAGWLWQTGVNIISGLVNGVAAMAGAIWNTISSVSSVIGRFFAGAGSWLYDVGKNIIQGLINGVGNMAHIATDAVKNVGKSIVDGVKSFLGIHSPSTLFDEEVGQQITAGLTQGINKGAKAAVSATMDMTHKVVGAGQTGMSSVQNPVTAMMNNSTSSQQVSYNFAQGSVVLSTAEAVGAFFNIGNRNTQLEGLGIAPLAGTTRV